MSQRICNLVRIAFPFLLSMAACQTRESTPAEARRSAARVEERTAPAPPANVGPTPDHTAHQLELENERRRFEIEKQRAEMERQRSEAANRELKSAFSQLQGLTAQAQKMADAESAVHNAQLQRREEAVRRVQELIDAGRLDEAEVKLVDVTWVPPQRGVTISDREMVAQYRERRQAFADIIKRRRAALAAPH